MTNSGISISSSTCNDMQILIRSYEAANAATRVIMDQG